MIKKILLFSFLSSLFLYGESIPDASILSIHKKNNGQKKIKEDDDIFKNDFLSHFKKKEKSVIYNKDGSRKGGDIKNKDIKPSERGLQSLSLFEPSILLSPIKRVWRPIDIIGITTEFVTQIFFPENITIDDALPSFEVQVLEYKKNFIKIRPASTLFVSGNIIISMHDQNGLYTMTIFLDRYTGKQCVVDRGEYICRRESYKKQFENDYVYNSLSAFYIYSAPTPMDDIETILYYEKVKKKDISKVLKRDGDRVTLESDGIFYDIVKNDKAKDKVVHYKDHQYSVTIRK